MTDPITSWQWISQNSTLLISVVSIPLASLGIILNWKTRKMNNKVHFEEKYKEEVHTVLNLGWADNNRGYHADYFFQDLQLNPKRTRMFLQHIYTCEETKKFYEQLEKMSKGDRSLFVKFVDEFETVRNDILTSTFPDFGTCKECIKNIKLDQAKKHKKLINDADPNMWSIFE